MHDPTRRVYDSILDLLPDVDNPTPLVRLHRVIPFRHTKVYAKLEWYNPFGAVKDRIAASMLRRAEEEQLIGPDQHLVEPTSGNTGLGLAMLANANGYTVTTTMSNRVPQEKRTMLRFFGARVVELDDDLCPAPGAPEGAIARAGEIAAHPAFHMLDQYGNAANPDAHYRTTGPEVWRQTQGTVTHFVAALGTCGTITGAGRFLKEQDPRVAVIGVHPNEGHDIPGVRSIRQLGQTRFFHPEEYDGVVEVDDGEAFDLCLQLNRMESVAAGPSSGLALAGALRTVPDEPGNTVVVIFPDSAFKYSSSFTRHLLGGREGGGGSRLLTQMVDNARVNPHLTIDAAEAHREWLDNGVAIVDVRSATEYAAGHIAGAVNVPLHELADRTDDLPADRSTPIFAVCARGNISIPGALLLTSIGYRNARSLSGGLNAWTEAGYEIE